MYQEDLEHEPPRLTSLSRATIEIRGTVALDDLLRAREEINKAVPDVKVLKQKLLEVHATLQVIHEMLKQSFQIDPHRFYWDIRPYFAGWKMVEPHGGVHYEGVDRPGVFRVHLGASAGQSTLFQCFDVLLGIDHGTFGQYLADIRPHMPGEHREFHQSLQETNEVRSIGKFVLEHEELQPAFDSCICDLAAFRATHFSIARQYVFKPAKEGGVCFGPLAQQAKDGGGIIGAGGTEVGPFLKSLVVDTRLARAR